MQRRTLLNVAAAAALSFFLPWRKAVASNPAPAPVATAPEKPGTLYADMKQFPILEVIGPPDKLMAFWHAYQTHLWPPQYKPDLRDPALEIERQKAQRSADAGTLYVYAGTYGRRSRPHYDAAVYAVTRMGCGMSERAAKHLSSDLDGNFSKAYHAAAARRGT